MNTAYIAGGAALAGFILELVILFFFLKMLAEAGALRENQRNEDIPAAAGISFPAVVIPAFLAYAILQRYLAWPVFTSNYVIYIFGMLGMAMLGFIDDMLGGIDSSSVKQQIAIMIQGGIAASTVRNFGVIVIGLFVAFFNAEIWWEWLLNALLIVMFTNLMNILETRPGRSVKAYLLFGAAIALTALGQIDFVLIAPLSGAVLACLLYELKTPSMTGYVGASVLGFTLGFWGACGLSLSTRIALLLFLIVMHLFTERYSLADVIANNRLLSRIDETGN